MASLIFSTNSKFKQVWEILIILVALAMSIVLPFAISIRPPFASSDVYHIVLVAVDVLFFIDILFTFRSAKFDLMTGQALEEPEEIARHYVLSVGFVVDVCSCLPWGQFGSSDVFLFLDLFKAVRVFRLGSVLSEMNVQSSTKLVSAKVTVDRYSVC